MDAIIAAEWLHIRVSITAKRVDRANSKYISSDSKGLMLLNKMAHICRCCILIPMCASNNDKHDAKGVYTEQKMCRKFDCIVNKNRQDGR